MELRQKRPTYEVAVGVGHIISSHQDMHPGLPTRPTQHDGWTFYLRSGNGLSHTHLTADINWSVCGPSKTMQPVNQLEFSFNLL